MWEKKNPSAWPTLRMVQTLLLLLFVAAAAVEVSYLKFWE
jgi:hypothetical protein